MAHAFDNRTQLTPPSKEVRHQTLKQMFEKRDRLTQQTGHYCGVTELTLRDIRRLKASGACAQNTRTCPSLPLRLTGG